MHVHEPGCSMCAVRRYGWNVSAHWEGRNCPCMRIACCVNYTDSSINIYRAIEKRFPYPAACLCRSQISKITVLSYTEYSVWASFCILYMDITHLSLLPYNFNEIHPFDIMSIFLKYIWLTYHLRRLRADTEEMDYWPADPVWYETIYLFLLPKSGRNEKERSGIFGPCYENIMLIM